MKQSETVQFDVGGTLYKVSRSLLSQHSETMLAKMASTWQRGKDPDALFIERDGEQFRYVLSYMRDGRVSLPANGTVSKDALLLDLEYYGFVNISATAITVSCMAVESVRYLFSLNESHKQRTEQHAKTIRAHQQRRLQLAQRHELEQRQLLEQQRAQMEAHDKHASSLEHYKLCMQFAFDLFKQYKESGNLQFSFATEMNVNPNNNNPNNDDFYSMPHPTDHSNNNTQLALQVLKGDKAPFNECLSQFGLECLESSGVQYSNDYSYSCVTLQLAVLGDKQQQQQQQQDGFADEAETTVSSSNNNNNNNNMEPVVVSDPPQQQQQQNPNNGAIGNHSYLTMNDASENGIPAAAIPAAGIPTKETSGSDNSQSNRSITPPLYRRKLFQQPQQQQQQVQQMQAQAQQQQQMPLPDHSNSSNNSNTSSALGNNSNSNNEILGSGTPPGLYQRVRVSRRGSGGGGGGGFFRQSQQQAFAPSPMTLDGDVVDGIHNNQNNNNNMNPATTHTMVLDPQQQQQPQQPPPQTTTTQPPPASPQPPVTVVPSSAPLYQRVSKMLSVSSAAAACDNNNNGTGNPADAPPVVLEVNEVV